MDDDDDDRESQDMQWYAVFETRCQLARLCASAAINPCQVTGSYLFVGEDQAGQVDCFERMAGCLKPCTLLDCHCFLVE